MRYIVYGAGAIGGVVGGRLFQHGHEVVLIARGRHLEAIKRSGLVLESPNERLTLPIPAVELPSELEPRPDDVVMLAMKTQDTEGALSELTASFSDATPILCLQNGVENERMALRHFRHVYAVPVMLPATHLEPGIVQANSANRTGVLDVGLYPSGIDALATRISADLAASEFSSVPDVNVMRKKYTKLLSNLGNALQAACGDANTDEIAARARDEAVTCYGAAGIDFASDAEDRDRRADHIRLAPIAGQRRGGGSTWQSLARGKTTVEADYLNGEICLLGRIHGVPTPVNALLQRVANRLARAGTPPGSMTPAELLAELG